MSQRSLLMVGNVYATRFALIRRLLDTGLHVEVFGPPWPRWLPAEPQIRACYTGHYLAREAKARAFRNAAVVLNSMASHESDGLNCRLFEAAGCGAVVLTEWRERLPSFFDVPGEVRSYRTFTELVDQALELVDLSASARRKLGNAAAARAHSEHTYRHRFETLCGALGRG
jgi:spore maturation protein CgeB